MLYCPKCQKLTLEQETCPECGKHTLRPPREDDIVLLAEEGYLRASMLEPLLEQAEIPFSKIGRLGSGIAAMIGFTQDTYRFYVPFAAYEAARDVALVLESGEDVEEDALAEQDSLDAADE